MCDKTVKKKNVIDGICAKTMLCTDNIRRIKEICNDFNYTVVVPLLENIAKKQDGLVSELRNHTSKDFEYCLIDMPGMPDYYEPYIPTEQYEPTEQKDAAELDDIPGFPSTENKNHCDGCCHYAEHPFAAENPF